MEGYAKFFLIIGLIGFLIVMPNIYWRARIWLLKRDGYFSESEFLLKYNLRRDDISDVMKGGPPVRVRSVHGKNFIDRETAKIILERLAAVRQGERTKTTQNAALGAAAGAAVAAALLLSSQSGDTQNTGSKLEDARRDEEDKRKWEERRKRREALVARRMEDSKIPLPDGEGFYLVKIAICKEFRHLIEHHSSIRSSREYHELSRMRRLYHEDDDVDIFLDDLDNLEEYRDDRFPDYRWIDLFMESM